MVFIVALLQTLINEGMPLSVDMRNLRIYTLLYDLQEVACCIVFWFLFSTQESKDKHVDVVQKQTRTCSHLFIQIHDEKQITCFMLLFSGSNTPTRII